MIFYPRFDERLALSLLIVVHPVGCQSPVAGIRPGDLLILGRVADCRLGQEQVLGALELDRDASIDGRFARARTRAGQRVSEVEVAGETVGRHGDDRSGLRRGVRRPARVVVDARADVARTG